MAASIRHIFGPFRSVAEDRQAAAAQKGGNADLRWHFFGVRSDASLARWILIYDPITRRFSASGVAMGEGWTVKRKNCDPALIDAMLPRRLSEMPVLTGRVVDILKARLSCEEMARAIAQSIRVT